MSQPTSRPTPDDIGAAARVAQVAVVLAVAAELRRWVAGGVSSPARLSAQVASVLARLSGQVAAQVPGLLARQFDAGARVARRQLADLTPDGPPTSAPRLGDGDRRTQPQSADTVARIEAAGRQVRRWAIQAHADVLDRAARDVAEGRATRLEAAQAAWSQLLDQGVTGFVDKAGRRWELASYVEMAVRTASAQASVQGHVDQLVADGHLYVLVSNAPSTCPKCAPWAGRVLSLTTRGRHTATAPSVITGRPVTFEVAGSLAEAVEAGLFHPGCRHGISAWLPQAPQTHHATTAAELRRGEQQDHLRYLERGVRRWKLRAAAALDPAEQRRANTYVRRWQAAIRAHAETTGIRRKPQRERVNAAR